MRILRHLIIVGLLVGTPWLWGCSDDTDKPADSGILDRYVLPDGPAGEKKIYLDGPIFYDQGPDLAPDQSVDGPGPDLSPPDQDCGKIACNCTYNGKKLYGKVQFVTSFPDIKVREVTAFEDLKVQQVTALASSCGKWEIVTALGDLKVQVVSAFEDIKIRYVTVFPGLP